MNILDTIQDDELFARFFRDKATWQAWFAFIAALFGLPMTPEQRATYEACTGRTEAPTQPFTEGWLICGLRAGKSFVLALIAVFRACFKTYGGIDRFAKALRHLILVRIDPEAARRICEDEA